jgi:hypothetical protein
MLERMGAEMAIDDINKSGGIKSLGGRPAERADPAVAYPRQLERVWSCVDPQRGEFPAG